ERATPFSQWIFHEGVVSKIKWLISPCTRVSVLTQFQVITLIRRSSRFSPQHGDDTMASLAVTRDQDTALNIFNLEGWYETHTGSGHVVHVYCGQHRSRRGSGRVRVPQERPDQGAAGAGRVYLL